MENMKQATKIVAASLLGDGNIHREGNKNARFHITQIPVHKDHVEYIGSFLEGITRLRRYEVEPKNDIVIMGHKTKSNGSFRITTMSHPFYTSLYNRWYGTGRKSIDPHYLTLLDYEMLAIWYMQDGSLGVRNQTIYKYPKFMTDNFSLAEVELLRRAVIERMDIIMNVEKNRKPTGEYYYRLRLAQKSIKKFIDGITPYIQPSFQYKLDI